jgi:hypothetical protein
MGICKGCLNRMTVYYFSFSGQLFELGVRLIYRSDLFRRFKKLID